MRRLKAPWSAQKTEGGYRVRDAQGRTLCYIYCRDDEKIALSRHWRRHSCSTASNQPGFAP